MPGSWRVEGDNSSTLANVGWWEALGDPVLAELVETALENNKDLQIAIWRVCEYYAQYEVARSPLFPQIDLNAAAAKQQFPSTLALPSGINSLTPEFTYDFNLSYEIDLWGQLRNAAFAAYSEYLAIIENRRTVVLTLVASVAQAYVYLRQLDWQYQISKETLAARKEALQIATYRFEGGLTSEIEVTQSDAAYQSAAAAVAEYERLIPEQENLLSVLLGENPHEIVRGISIDQMILPAEIPAGLPSDLLERRPDIRQAENELIAANANIGVAKAAFFPQISLTAFFGAGTFELKKLFSHTSRAWQLGGNLLQTIFSGWRLTGQLNMAEAQKQELCFHYQQKILDAFREVDSSLISHEKSKEIAAIDAAQVEDLKEYLTLSWLRYYEGQTDYLTVLDAETRLFNAEIDYAAAMSDQFLTLVALYKALGGGWVIDADREAIGDEPDEQNCTDR